MNEVSVSNQLCAPTVLVTLHVGLIELLHILLLVQFIVQVIPHLLQIQRLAITAQKIGAIEGAFSCALQRERWHVILLDSMVYD